jgi:hypothetical protein
MWHFESFLISVVLLLGYTSSSEEEEHHHIYVFSMYLISKWNASHG